MNETLVSTANDFKRWFINYSLPLWSGRGINLAGASYERLLKNGEPDVNANVRVRVQARQIFVFSLAADLGWLQGGEELVSGLSAFIDAHGRHRRGGYVHLLNAQFEVVDGKQDLYDHAFFLLASAWRYRVFKDEFALREADAILNLLNNNYKSTHGGWVEGDYAVGARRQNPHMHLFEAFLAMYEASRDDKWIGLAAEMFGLFEKHFYCGTKGVLLENFREDWQALEGEDEQGVEPGHMMEWVWLLRKYSQLSATPVDDYADTLYQSAIENGLATNGLLYDELDLAGDVKKASMRCWPMTELIKASIAQATVSSGAKKTEYETIAARALLDLQKHYLQNASTQGAYVDLIDENSQVLVDVAPASTLYHLIMAAAEVCHYVGIQD